MTPPRDSVFEGVAVPPGPYLAPAPPRPRYRTVAALLAVGLGVGYAVMGVWNHSVQDASIYRCPPDCGSPPNSIPVANLPRFEGPGFSVSQPPSGTHYDVTTGADGVTARQRTGGGVLRLYSERAEGRGARQIVDRLLARQYPGSTVAYELPNAMVGYQVGYGVVANFQAPGVAATYDLRLIVMAAVKNDLALLAVAEGPFRRFSPDFGPGPPSAANLEIAMDMGTYVDSFRWAGDPPR